MASIALYDQLDSAIDALLASREAAIPDSLVPDAMVPHAREASVGDLDVIADLMSVADDLRDLPRPMFRMKLRSELIAAATTADVAIRAFPLIQGGARSPEASKLDRELKELPTLFASVPSTTSATPLVPMAEASKNRDIVAT